MSPIFRGGTLMMFPARWGADQYTPAEEARHEAEQEAQDRCWCATPSYQATCKQTECPYSGRAQEAQQAKDRR